MRFDKILVLLYVYDTNATYFRKSSTTNSEICGTGSTVSSSSFFVTSLCNNASSYEHSTTNSN